MDSIQRVIHTMDEQHQKEFVNFIQRNKYRKGRKDLMLFNMLKLDKHWTTAEIINQLQTTNSNAYHTIRKRLFKHISDFFILKSISDDASPVSHVGGLIAVVNYLFDKGLHKHAWKYLHLAESIADHNHFYELLNTLYLMQIDYAHYDETVDLGAVILKYEGNQQMLRRDEKVKIAMGLIRQNMELAKRHGSAINFQELIDKPLKKLKIDNTVLDNPKIMLQIQQIIRVGALAKKDFFAYEPYLLNTYNRLYGGGEFRDSIVKSEFLYLIAHTYYRNKKFEQSFEFITKMKDEMLHCSKSFQKKYYARLTQLTAANLVFLSHLDNAINLLNELYDQKSKLSTQEGINTVVNLCIYHFLNADYSNAKKMLSKLTHSDSWYQKLFGIEWVFKKNLMEIILFIELEHFDLAESRLRAVERSYEQLKANEIYAKAFDFVWLIRQYLNKHTQDVNEFKETIVSRINFVPKEQEDLQAMAFYAWMKAKAEKKAFYLTLLQVFS